MPGTVNQIAFDDLEFNEEIGQGGFSTVYEVEWTRKERDNTDELVHSRRTKIKAAAKCLNKVERSELEILSRLKHPNIVKLLGVVDESPEFFLVLELCEGGSLRSYLDAHSTERLHICLICAWGEQSARSIEYLQKEQVIHRDVKSSNFLISGSKNVKLCDFGLAKEADKTITTKAKGTWGWAAPEVFTENHISPLSDVFAYATMLWEIFTCQIPFDKASYEDVMEKMCKRGERPVIPDNCPTEIALLMKKCWDADRTKRPSIGQVLEVICKFRAQIQGEYTEDLLKKTLPFTSIKGVIENVDGEPMILEVPHGTTIANVKLMILKTRASSAQKSLLFYGDKELEDSMTLLDYDIDEGTTLHLRISKKISVTIVTSRKRETIIVEVHKTIADVKATILKTRASSAHKSLLFYDEKELEDNMTLLDYEIDEGTTLHLRRVVKLLITMDTSGKKEPMILEVHHDTTIANIKSMILKTTTSSAQKSLLFYGDKELEDNMTLLDYDIGEGATLYFRRSLKLLVTMFMDTSRKRETIILEVHHDTTIANVRSMILKTKASSDQKSMLFYGDKELDDNMTLLDYGIDENATLHLRRVMKLFITMNTSGKEEPMILEVHSDTTIANVKSMILKTNASSAQKSLLFYGDKELEGNMTLLDYDIDEGATLYLRRAVKLFVSMDTSGKKEPMIFKVHHDTTIADVKSKILETRSSSAQKSMLFYGDKELDDNMTLLDYDIAEGATLYFRRSLKLSVTMLMDTSRKRETIILEVHHDTTIANVRSMILKTKASSAQKSMLFYGDKELVDNMTLLDYDIDEDTTLHLRRVVKLFITMNTSGKGEPIILEVHHDTTIANVKSTILKTRFSSAQKSLLFYGDKELEDNMTLLDYDIDEGATLYLSRIVMLFVTMDTSVNEEPMILEVLHDTTIANVKSAILKTRASSAQKSMLFYGDKELEDNMTLLDYNIDEGDTLYLGRSMNLLVTMYRSEKDLSKALHVLVEDTISAVKEKTGFPSGGQLFFGDRLLEDERKIVDYHLNMLEDEVQLSLYYPLEIIITIQGEERVSRIICPNQTVRDLKKMLQVDACQPDAIICDGIQLEDHLTISACNIKDTNTLQGLHWKQTQNIGILMTSGCWLTNNQLAISSDNNSVEVRQVTAETNHLLYTLTTGAFKYRFANRYRIVGIAVNGPAPDRIFVCCRSLSHSRSHMTAVYQFPCHESSHHDKKYQILDRNKEPTCIAANAKTAVVGLHDINNGVLAVYALPDFSHQRLIPLSFVPHDLSITTDYLLVMGKQEMLVKAVNDIENDLNRIKPPGGLRFDCVTSRHISKEIYVAFWNEEEKGMYLFKYTGHRKDGKLQYVSSGCVLEYGNIWSNLSLSSSGLLAARLSYKSTTPIFSLGIQATELMHWSVRLFIGNAGDGEKQLLVFSDESIAAVKSKAGFPPEAQLFNDTVWLEDHCTIRDYCIEDDAKLHMELMKEIALKCSTDKKGHIETKTIRVCPSHTIKDLKTMLRTGYVADIPPKLRLGYDTELMNDYLHMRDVDPASLQLELPQTLSVQCNQDEGRVSRTIYHSQTVCDLKKMLQVNDYQPDAITCDGIQLEDHLTISQCNITDNNTIQGLSWKEKQNIEISGQSRCWLTDNQLAVGCNNSVEVLQVTAETHRPLYTLTTDKFNDVQSGLVGIAVNGPVPDRIFVCCSVSDMAAVYQFPCHESSQHDKKYHILDGNKKPNCIAANAKTAVVGLHDINNGVLAVYALPDFSHQRLIPLSFLPHDLSITTDYLLVMGKQEMLVKTVNDIENDLNRIKPPGGLRFECVTSRHISKEIYVACWNEEEEAMYLFKYTGHRKYGKPQYVSSGCVLHLEYGSVWSNLSLSSSGLLAGTYLDKFISIFSLGIPETELPRWSITLFIGNAGDGGKQLHVFSDESIAAVKSKAGFPPEAQLFNDTVWLEDLCTIHDYCIEDEAKLHAESIEEITLKCSTNDQGNIETRTIRVCPSHTIKDLKTMLRTGYGEDIPTESRLFCDTELMNDYLQMRDVDQSTLQLELPQTYSVQCNKESKTLTTNICPSATIRELKQMLQVKEEILPDEVVHNGVPLDDHRTISACGICKGDTLSCLQWDLKHEIATAGDTFLGHRHTVHWVMDDQLAVCVCVSNEVQVYKVNAEGALLVYSLTTDEWNANNWPLYIATNGPTPDRIFVICSWQSYVYQFPCQASTQYARKHHILGSRAVESIAANSNTAVVGIDTMESQYKLVVFTLPDFTQQRIVDISIGPDYLSIALDYLLVMGRDKILVKSLGNIDEDLHTILAPSYLHFQAVVLKYDAKQIYVACVDENDENPCVYKYIWNGNGTPRFVKSCCVIKNQDDFEICSLSLSKAGLLAAKGKYQVNCKVFALE